MKPQNETEFTILVASDCHLGYNEKHPIRGDDSFRTFEEVLQAAQKFNVDFILMAGDLFHVNRPSMQTLSRTMFLIRKYCFGGDGDRKFKIKNFKNSNYLDPNLRVRHPIFTIHGNHDDPIGMDRACCIDLLSESGLINYFGKHDNVEKLFLKPILFEKNHIKLMLFGFGSMREERLNHLITTEKFHYLVPESEDEKKNYLKILVVHQNRVPRPNTKHLNPYDLSDLPDLVIWGHEHQPATELFKPNKFFILQPGSTVATSLCDSEFGDKFYYILRCVQNSSDSKPKFKIESHRCETVRRFVIQNIDIDNVLAQKAFKTRAEQRQFLQDHCSKEIQKILSDVRKNSSESEEKPLIRLRMTYEDRDLLFDRGQFELTVNDLVANTNDIVRFVKKRSTSLNNFSDEQIDYNFIEMIDSIDYEEALKKIHVKSVMEQHFATATSKQKLSILDENFFTDKILDYVEKKQSDVLTDFFDNTRQAFTALILSECDHLESSEEDFKEFIGKTKKRIENDGNYRRQLEWISKEPYVERLASVLKRKLALKESMQSEIFNTEKETSKKEEDDFFYQDDIDMFGDDEIDPNKSNKNKLNNSGRSQKSKKNFTQLSRSDSSSHFEDLDSNQNDNDDEDIELEKFENKPKRNVQVKRNSKIPPKSRARKSQTKRNDEDEGEFDDEEEEFDSKSMEQEWNPKVDKKTRATTTSIGLRKRVKRMDDVEMKEISDDDDVIPIDSTGRVTRNRAAVTKRNKRIEEYFFPKYN
ncbi:Double-strand break repair protein MRE11 [Sarcoptes scabiei]|uniref:Double-strand break repair protein n=1 Tax=Sarcoptes scabiei TaxID=52283 RepID=A0A834RCZ3_SARSC|nr:Double-strand break repair protein MRE11 [Sarcoptes scabiei]